MKAEKTCCFTGHRRILPSVEKDLKRDLRREVVRLIEEDGVTRFLSGGALGFDTLAAETVLELVDAYPDVKLVIVRPCVDQTRGWGLKDVERYALILRRASDVVTVAHTYYPGCMQERNRYLVDHADVCLCFLEDDTGGTAYTVRYAERAGIPVINLSPKARENV